MKSGNQRDNNLHNKKATSNLRWLKYCNVDEFLVGGVRFLPTTFSYEPDEMLSFLTVFRRVANVSPQAIEPNTESPRKT